VPVNVSTSVVYAEPKLVSPTATQLVGVAQAIPFSNVAMACVGLALAMWVQAVPFQYAINEYSGPGWAPQPSGTEYMPTAKELFALGHDTLDRRFSPVTFARARDAGVQGRAS